MASESRTVLVSMECPYTRSALESAFSTAPLDRFWSVRHSRNPDPSASSQFSADDDEPSFSFGGYSVGQQKSKQEVDSTLLKQWEEEIGLASLQWSDYEQLDWDRVNERTLVANAYCVRKGLIRKAQLSFNIAKFVTKKSSGSGKASLPEYIARSKANSESDFQPWQWTAEREEAALASGFPFSIPITIDDPDYVDEALCDLPEIRDMEPYSKTWILKPNMCNQGSGIHLIASEEQFREVVEDEENEDIREWVVQEYIERPLLVDGRKFHLRAYVLAIGSLKLYFYQDVLSLFSLHRYPSPEDSSSWKEQLRNYSIHLTNTCYQKKSTADPEEDYNEDRAVRLLQELDSELPGGKETIEYILSSMERLTAETFQACAGEVGFFPLPNCFELFGLDFLIEDKGSHFESPHERMQVYLLEVNAEPDFIQTGDRLRGMIEHLLHEAALLISYHFFPNTETEPIESSLKREPRFRRIYERLSPFMAGQMA